MYNKKENIYIYIYLHIYKIDKEIDYGLRDNISRKKNIISHQLEKYYMRYVVPKII